MANPRKRRSKDEPAEGARPSIEEQDRSAALFERLDALGLALSDTRKEAITARLGSGIETVWLEDEEHYEGIDDKNRGVTASSWQSKPPGQAHPNTPANESIVFPNITRAYVDAAAAKVGDILLPTDDRSWGLKETPVPEFVEKAKGKLPLEVLEGMAKANVPEQAALQVAQTEQAHYQSLIDAAIEKAKKAQTRIEDWHVEGQWHAEVRKVIEDCCKIGSGVLKGPVPEAKRAQMFKDGALIIQEEIKPISKRINPWNFYPDGACGESIHNGSYVWERDFISEKQLRALKLDPDYIGRQIDQCLNEGPKKATDERKTADGRIVSEKGIYEIWYYHGDVSKEDMEAAGCPCEKDAVPAVLTMVNDRVIKAALNPLDNGAFPYDVMPWSARKNMPWGFGVSRLGRTPQQMIVAATRAMLTNAGRSAGPLIILRDDVNPADGSEDITPWKVYRGAATDQGSAQDMGKIMEIPSRTEELMQIIQLGMKLFEDATGLPLLLQGQQGSAPETLGGQQLVDRNASTVLRRVARTFDDYITEPHIRRYYAWLLQYGPDEEKGEFVIDARGSTALVEREFAKQHNQRLLEASLNPAFGLNPKKAMEEDLRANNRNPKAFQYSEEELKQQAEAQQKQAPDPSVEIAKIRAEADMKLEQFKAQEAEKDRRHQKELKLMERDIKAMELAQSTNTDLAKIKATLAGKVMDLRTQKELAAKSGKSAQVAKPAVEPPGRAPAGRAFPQ